MGAPQTGGPWGRGQPRATRAGAPPNVQDLNKEAGLCPTSSSSPSTLEAAPQLRRLRIKQGTVCARRGQTFPVSCLTPGGAAHTWCNRM